ncbi:MAG: HlyD family efflux transporter periplasmic adaptor subunit [Cyclobacteriaceae bacterium]|nr:HlyD family efflux transporter periplasmic adaptor subunit [Cyclobacteriaceae bacterium]
MKTTIITTVAAIMLISVSCNRNDDLADAYGNFEVDETVVSALMPGEIMQFEIKEGSTYTAGQFVGYIDTIQLHLLKPELEANRMATANKTENISTQIEVLKKQLANLEREHKRVINLLEAGAATSKQQDDIEGQIDVVKSQIRSAKSQYSGVLAQLEAIDAKMKQLDEKIRKSRIVNPINGIVLTKLAEPFEFTATGKPLYKIANIEQIDLRAYVSGDQLPSIKLGDTFTVKIDGPEGEMIDYPGKVIWISSEGEFTPKTIQTKKERIDMVYAVKIRVENDGRIKIGMPGELWLNIAE